MRFIPKNIPITTASQAGYPSNLVRFNKNNFQPRIGFAYKPLDDKTVIRGGYGIYTNLIYATLARSHLTGGPFSGSVTYNNGIDNGVPLFSFPSPFLTSRHGGGAERQRRQPGSEDSVYAAVELHCGAAGASSASGLPTWAAGA